MICGHWSDSLCGFRQSEKSSISPGLLLYEKCELLDGGVAVGGRFLENNEFPMLDTMGWMPKCSCSHYLKIILRLSVFVHARSEWYDELIFPCDFSGRCFLYYSNLEPSSIWCRLLKVSICQWRALYIVYCVQYITMCHILFLMLLALPHALSYILHFHFFPNTTPPSCFSTQ